MARKPKGSVNYYKKKLDIEFKRFIRARDKRCLRCGSLDNLQASHSIPVSHGNRLRYDGQNVITLCFHCHLSWWHKNPIEAGEWFKSRFPERYKYLQRVKNERVKFTISDLEELVLSYKRLIKGLGFGTQ